jgi:outer membrane protein assembly factor BamB
MGAFRTIVGFLLIAALPLGLRGEDWPQWRGADRLGVWRESGILKEFPEGGLKVAWRQSIGRGYSGPAVAAGKIFITEFEPTGRNAGVERAVALDEQTGAVLWRAEWPVDYTPIEYNLGPRATPTVEGDRVYVLGAVGDLLCLNSETGEVIWRVNFAADYGAQLPVWGTSGHPLVEGDLLIAVAGGRPDAKVVAFDKRTGKEAWRAIADGGEPGYSPPTIIEAGGVRQLIVWHGTAVTSLDPANGKVHWEQPFKPNFAMAIATPVLGPHGLLVSCFYDGSRMYRLDENRPAAELLWRGNSNSEIETDGLHTVVTTPIADGDYIYGIDSYGQLRALNARTGERLWETQALTVENARWASAQIVRHEDRYFINNDRGELIIAKLTPEGYQELDRIDVMKPTQPLGRRRDKGAVLWTHPAYANRHMVIRNDEEIVRYSLAAGAPR